MLITGNNGEIVDSEFCENFDDAWLDLELFETFGESADLSTCQQDDATSFKKNDKGVKKNKVHKSSTVKTVRKLLPNYPEMKLLVFPSFDKSDAMVYFPSTFARLRNSGDTEGVVNILRLYCKKDCQVDFLKTSPGFNMSMSLYSTVLQVDDTLNPDTMTCMLSTKVVDNQIIAELYHKRTDTAEMYKYVDMAAGPLSAADKWLFVGNRKDILARNLRLDKVSAELRDQICGFIDAEEDFQVYSKTEMVITFDLYSKKITHIGTYGLPTSVCKDGTHYNFQCSS